MPHFCSNKNSIHDLTARKRRREKRRLRKRVIFSGWKTNVLNGFCLVAASLLCFAHFEHLQADADYKLFQLPGNVFDNLQTNLHGIVCYGHWISALMLFFHSLAIKFAKTRFTFPSLLAFFAWIINAFLHMEQNHHHDYLISRLAFSAFTVLITTAIIFLPKKLKRTKRQNTLYSAFSVASTPTSQQTSQFNNSQLSFCDRTIDFDDNATMLSGRTYFSTNSTNGLFRDKMERNNAWLMENSRNRFNANYKANSYATNDTMSLRSGKTFASGTTQQSTTKFMKWREKNRESTPLREVRQLVDNLFLSNNSTEEEDSSGDEKSSTLTNGRRSNYSVCIS